jgi:ankyrin repeat protein
LLPIKERDKQSNTVLHLAALNGHKGLVQFLSDKVDMENMNREAEVATLPLIGEGSKYSIFINELLNNGLNFQQYFAENILFIYERSKSLSSVLLHFCPK